MSRLARSVCGLALALCILQATPLVIAQSQDLIVDICTTPNKYWNRQVFLKGHVVKVTPDPPGTNRGRYTLRDQSDKDIEVATDDLPAQGKVYVINGVVEQRKPGDNVPVVREGSRSLGQPDSAVAAVAPAPAAPAAAPAAPPAATAVRPAAPAAGKVMTKSEVEEAVRRELEKAKTQTAAAPAPVTPAPAPVAPAPAPAAPSLFENPLVIGAIVVAVVAIIGIMFIVMRSKPASAAPAAYAPPPPQAAAPTMASAPSAATQVASSAATMAASRGTEVFTRLGGELTVAEGPDRGRNLVIGKPVVTIGRSGSRKNDLELSDSTVSREQAKVLYNSGDRSFKVVNESTTNPTRINGATVDAAVLQDGDRLEFGNTIVKFKKT
jgi:hypothetical protein